MLDVKWNSFVNSVVILLGILIARSAKNGINSFLTDEVLHNNNRNQNLNKTRVVLIKRRDRRVEMKNIYLGK